MKNTFMNIAHIIITLSYIEFLIGVNFRGDLHLDVNKLKLKVKIGIFLSMVE